MIDKCGVVTVDGGRRIVEGGQKVGTDVPHLRRILMQAADHILDVAGVQLQQPAFHNLLWVVLASNADHFSGAAYRVYQNVQNFIQQVAVIAQVFSENVILNILLQNLPIGPYRIHRISRRRRSILRRLRRRMDRWISIVPISLILISIDCVRFSEVKSSGLGKCRLPVFGSLDFLFPDKVLNVDFCGAALALLLALNQAHLVQLGEQGHRLVMAAAHRVHRFFQREVDEHALLFVQPAIAYGQPHAV